VGAKATVTAGFPQEIQLPLEVRVHGRGGQGGVTCAKIIASIYAELGLHVQTFGDYGSERTGAPIRAFTRVDTAPIVNRNKVYRPHHVLVLDAALLADDVLEGADAGAVVLLNTARGLAPFADTHGHFRFAAADATAIARRHGIGTSAVVIINTTLAGAYSRAMGLPWEAVERAFAAQGLARDLGAAREAWDSVEVREADDAPDAKNAPVAPARRAPAALPVVAITEHLRDLPTPLRTGSWRTQAPLYRSHLAPCNAGCPAGNDVVGFVQELKNNGVEAAARVLLRTQPLPSVCGRVCPAPCMAECNRGAYDGAVDIRGLERWIGDHVDGAPARPALAAAPRRVAVVGSGPAGLGAAWALALAGHDVTIHEGEARLGGVLRTGIPSYRLPDDALDRDLDRIISLGVKIRTEAFLDRAGVERLAAGNDAVILAAGLPRLTGLDAPGADLPGAVQGIRFLDAAKRDGAARLSGHVVVVGGGNTAIDCARTALRCGAAEVTIVYRRGRKEMPAIAPEIDEALAEGVKLLVHRQPVRVLGAGRVEAIEIAEVEMGENDASGRRRPVVTGRTSTMPCDRVLLALGQAADLSLLPAGTTVRDGRAVSSLGPTRVWLAGDMATGDGTVTHAIGNGRRTAARVLAALGGESDPVAPTPPAEDLVTPAHVRFSHFEVEPPNQEFHLPAGSRVAGFDEVSLGLPGPEEAHRCFSCGICTHCDTCLLYCPEGVIRRQGEGYRIDEAYCKGCGMCVAECPRDAMEMVPEASAR
jgi:2-oxoacid:acceptor oxidoreductase gamma subunit (pyruvate/2-ketoisovalerate family)